MTDLVIAPPPLSPKETAGVEGVAHTDVDPIFGLAQRVVRLEKYARALELTMIAMLVEIGPPAANHLVSAMDLLKDSNPNDPGQELEDLRTRLQSAAETVLEHHADDNG